MVEELFDGEVDSIDGLDSDDTFSRVNKLRDMKSGGEAPLHAMVNTRGEQGDVVSGEGVKKNLDTVVGWVNDSSNVPLLQIIKGKLSFLYSYFFV